jgi:hypothetical protein
MRQRASISKSLDEKQVEISPINKNAVRDQFQPQFPRETTFNED